MLLSLFCCVPPLFPLLPLFPLFPRSRILFPRTLPTPYSGGMSGDPATVTGVSTPRLLEQNIYIIFGVAKYLHREMKS
jgi:hypothetical protein